MPILRAFRRFFDLERHDPNAVKLYNAVVDQSRTPVFYSGMDVSDSVDGRFDMIVLHLFLILNRFPLDERQHPVLRALLEEHFTDMDNSLREIGVGDLSVPKKIHRMIDALYGRFESYEAALNSLSPVEDLAAALERNIYRREPGEDSLGAEKALERMTRYVLETRSTLAQQGADTILNGDIVFPAPKLGEG